MVSSSVVPSCDEPAQHLPEIAAAARVEAGGRLVEEQHRRRGDEADREVEPPAHATRVRPHRPVGGVGDRELFQQFVCQPVEVAPADAVQAADHPDVLAPGQQFVDGGDLAGQAHVAAHHVGFVADVVAGDPGGAAGRHRQRRHHPDRGGLARPVGAEQPEHGSGSHGEADAIDGGVVAEPLHQIDGFDGRGEGMALTVSAAADTRYRATVRSNAAG